MKDILLKTESLSAGYGPKLIASDINIQVNEGEIVSLIGPNGSGKTTILKTVAAFLEPLDGALYLDGRDLTAFPKSEMSKIMAVMMTERMSAEQMTVEEVVSMGRYPYTGMLGRLAKEDKEVISKALERVGLLDLSERAYNSLSDGQKQRALLARAISQEPRLMILDEPTSYLDIYHKLRFIDILKELVREEGISVLMSVHELEIAYEISDRVICLSHEGKIVSSGTPEEVFSEEIIDELYGLKEGRMTKMYGGFLKAIKGE